MANSAAVGANPLTHKLIYYRDGAIPRPCVVVVGDCACNRIRLVNSNNWRQTFARNNQFVVRNTGEIGNLQGTSARYVCTERKLEPHEACLLLRPLTWERRLK